MPVKVYTHFVQANPNSLLAKVLRGSTSYITKSSDQGELHPWSTWPTLHRGVDNTAHHIKDLGEDLNKRDASFPPVWKLLTKQGLTVGTFGSLHTFPLPSDLTNYAFVVPDPFANESETLPRSIEPFQAFNLAMSRRSGRSVDRGIDWKRAFRLLLALPGMGLRMKTIGKTVSHLWSERMAPWKASRRRAFQSILAFDVYFKLLKNHQPTFTTFFSNHVASAMHRYWAAAFPEDYANNNLPLDWIERYKDEIEWSMWQTEEMLKDLISFIHKNPEYKLIIASSMGQEATKAELIHHELFLGNYEQLNHLLGNVGIEPVSAMHPQYNFTVPSDSAGLVEEQLATISINSKPLRFRRKEDKFFSIDLGYPNIAQFDVQMGGRKLDIANLGFEVRDIDDQSGGTAYHIPEGSFYVYDPQHPVTNAEPEEVDLREVAPSILKLFGVDRPDYMKEGIISAIYE